MAERLTVSLEDGRLEQLRTLAGGERKVGAYLSGVVSWLWLHREALETRPLSDFAPVLQEWIPRLTMSPEEQQEELEELRRLREQIKAGDRRLDTLEMALQEMIAGRLEESKTLLATLPTQQDSSSNDA
jgi:hypothetical protein